MNESSSTPGLSGLAIVGIISLGLLGFLIGLGLRAELNRLRYRIITGRHHDERNLPNPGARWWLPFGLGLAWFALGTAFAHDGWPWIVLWCPFAAAGAWLAAVDLDVQRLPDRVLIPTGCFALAAGVTLIVFGYAYWLPAVVGLVSTTALFGLIHFLSKGGLGFGDVKFVAVCGWCLGLMGWNPIFIGLILACALGIVFALIRRTRAFAFGPWLVFGAVATAILVGFHQAGALPFPL